jgi:dolichol kinase
MSLIYPLHEALCVTLRYLTTTSLLRAELQLLSIALINLLLLSLSPQTIVLQAVLWGGGVGILITCGQILKWVVALARIPKWRFRRPGNLMRRAGFLSSMPGGQITKLGVLTDLLGVGNGTISDESDTSEAPVPALRRQSDLKANFQKLEDLTDNYAKGPAVFNTIQRSDNKGSNSTSASLPEFMAPASSQRRHTLPSVSQPMVRLSKTTPSGRRKRSASSSLRSFFSLTEREAMIRKLIYAAYVYICVAVIILAVIRPYVGKYALAGNEPIGWALGYLLGNIPWFRMQVITTNLERWICLPERNSVVELGPCHQGWVEHLRQATFGPANTRLILSAYWLGIIIVGLAIVFRLSAICEVDTRRKVFHFMMVAMLLPATYVDPAFAALALSLVLAIFLLLDLFRASQLPPLSKPLAQFLTPYVDGRDLRGPVVISHIFLLIGCAIPLWLSLSALPRSGRGPWTGWDLPTRDVSMVSGVICVGMGDSAASLVGRRFGRHKWFWGGGKSLEGSLAFAVAVGSALVLAKAWLRIGGWPESRSLGGSNSAAATTIINTFDSANTGYDVWIGTTWKAAVAAGVASLTEAVLTGGNDNVVVPIVLWLVVKGLGI